MPLIEAAQTFWPRVECDMLLQGTISYETAKREQLPRFGLQRLCFEGAHAFVLSVRTLAVNRSLTPLRCTMALSEKSRRVSVSTHMTFCELEWHCCFAESPGQMSLTCWMPYNSVLWHYKGVGSFTGFLLQGTARPGLALTMKCLWQRSGVYYGNFQLLAHPWHSSVMQLSPQWQVWAWQRVYGASSGLQIRGMTRHA